MATGAPTPIPFALSSFPGANPQEGSGRLINCYAEPLGEATKPTGPAQQVWRRSPGLSQHAATAQSGYRGGLIVNNLSYETWLNEAATVDINGNVTLLGNFPGSKKVSIARNQAANPDVVAVDQDNGAYILNTSDLAAASATVTIAGTQFAPGDTVALFFANTGVAGFPVNIIYTLGSNESPTTIATGLKNLINANATLVAAQLTAANAAGVLTVSQNGFIANATTIETTVTAVGNATALTGTKTGAGNETVTVAPGSGTATATIGGSVFDSGDTVSLTFSNASLSGFPVTVTHTLGAGETATTIATALTALINANAALAAASITAASALGVITLTEVIGNETATLNPVSGTLSGGAGTQGIVFAGAPLAYNGQGNLPQPNSVCFQDGYFFFTIAKGQCYASGLNSLTQNALTYITAQAKSDVTLLRGIAFSGLLLLFTTGSCEVWQDAALPAPAFPYSRLLVLEYGLVQAAAIAGWETGFSELLWVAQDFGVYWMTAGSLAPIKVSSPDLERLIEAQVRAGNTLEAGCYAFAGRKQWCLSSPSWSWEFSLTTRKWNERSSFGINGLFGRWRATGGHPAFGKWLIGDELSGNLLWVDSSNFTENGAVQLFRIESGPVKDFPNQIRIARADFDFDMGVGIAVGNIMMTVMGAAAGTNGVVRLTVNSTAGVNANDQGNVVGVTGTTEANGSFPMTVIDATHIELQGTKFINAYVSGGTVVDVTSPPNAINPMVAISCSKNGGQSWGNPLLRALGAQAKAKRARASVKNMGQSGPMGDRWRLDVTDPVYVGFLGGTQSSNPREVGA
jgi:hypothetical protein